MYGFKNFKVRELNITNNISVIDTLILSDTYIYMSVYCTYMYTYKTSDR